MGIKRFRDFINESSTKGVFWRFDEGYEDLVYIDGKNMKSQLEKFFPEGFQFEIHEFEQDRTYPRKWNYELWIEYSEEAWGGNDTSSLKQCQDFLESLEITDHVLHRNHRFEIQLHSELEGREDLTYEIWE